MRALTLIVAFGLTTGCTLLLDTSPYVAQEGPLDDAGPVEEDAGPPACGCASPTPHCADGLCVECLGDAHCASGEACDPLGRCVGACAVASDCDGGETCDSGRCVPCDEDGDGFERSAPGCAGTPADCDDTHPGVYPGATPVCGDGVRQSCDEGLTIPGGYAEVGRLAPFVYPLPTGPFGGAVYLRSLEIAPLDDRGDASNPDALLVLLTDGPSGPDAQMLTARVEDGAFLGSPTSLSGLLAMHGGVPGLGLHADLDGDVLLSVFDGGDRGAALLDITDWLPSDGSATIRALTRSASFVGEWPDPQMRITAGPALAWRECAMEGGSRLFRMNPAGSVTQVVLPDAYCGDRTTLAAGGGVVMSESYNGTGPSLSFWGEGGAVATHAIDNPNGVGAMVEFPSGEAVAVVPVWSGLATFRASCRGGGDPSTCVTAVTHPVGENAPWGEVRATLLDAERAVVFGPGPSTESFNGLALRARFVTRDGHVATEGLGAPVSVPILDAADVGHVLGIIERVAATTVPREGGVDVLVAAETEPLPTGSPTPPSRDVWVSGLRVCEQL